MVDDRVYVLDACAFIALLENEPGAEVVERLLSDGSNRCLIHIVNACEVYVDLLRRDNPDDAAALESILVGHGIELVDSMQPGLWKQAGDLKAGWRRISLADCFGLALTLELGGSLVTSDHHESDRLAEAGLCNIHFIR